MSKALIVYATRTNQTRKIAEVIAEGLRTNGSEVTLLNVNEFDKQQLDPQTFDAVVLGAATYHGEMMAAMKTFLFALEKYNLEGKTGGAFGAFGWSGEAPGRIYDTMKNIYKMNLVDSPLRIKSAAVGDGAKKAQDYGMEIAKKMAG